MKSTTIITAAAIAAIAGIASTAIASSTGVMDTERFGYAGQVTRHATLADAQAGANVQDTISVTDRDLAMTFANGDGSYSDQNIALGSWWHTTDTFFSPTQGRAGWGNTTGNTGVGYLQLFDSDSSTDTSQSFSFSNFDGTFWTDFNFSASGENADAADFSRFSAIDNVNDGGIWHSWSVNLTATGLQGTAVGGGFIEATNHATGVTGSITAIFEITENQTSPANQGFYAINLDLNMINWAFANQALLTPEVSLDGGATFFDGTFQDSFFRAVPTPGAVALFGLAGLAAARRRR